MKKWSHRKILSVLLVLCFLAVRPASFAQAEEQKQAPVTWEAFDQAFYKQLTGEPGVFSDIVMLPEPFYSNGRWARGHISDGIYMRFVTTSPGPDGLVIDAMIYADPRMDENIPHFMVSLIPAMYRALTPLEGTPGDLLMTMLMLNPDGLYQPLDHEQPFQQNGGYDLFIGADEGGFLVAHATYTGEVSPKVSVNPPAQALWETMQEPMALDAFIERVSPHLALYDYAPLETPDISKDQEGRPVYTYALNDTLTMSVTLKSDEKDAPVALIHSRDKDNIGPYMYSVGLVSLYALCDMDVDTFLSINAIGGYKSIFDVLATLKPYVVHQGVGIQFHADEAEWFSEVYGAVVPDEL